MKTIMIPIILTAAFLLVGCELAEEGPTPIDTQPDIELPAGESFVAEYADGVLSYSARIMVPTPCHDVRIDEMILESDPIQVRIDVSFTSDPDEMCAQVIDERTIEGRITLQEEPGSVTLVTPFETYEATV